MQRLQHVARAIEPVAAAPAAAGKLSANKLDLTTTIISVFLHKLPKTEYLY